MKLRPLTRDMKLYARRVINIGSGQRILPGQEFDISAKGPGALSWRRICQLYDQRRVISESDPYFEELMNEHGKPTKVDAANEAATEEEILADMEAEVDAANESKPAATVVEAGGGWYDVYAGDKKLNDKRLRKNDAEDVASMY